MTTTKTKPPATLAEVPAAVRRAADGWKAAAQLLAADVDAEHVDALHAALLVWIGRWFEEVVEPEALEDEPVPAWDPEVLAALRDDLPEEVADEPWWPLEPRTLSGWLLPVMAWTEAAWHTRGDDEGGPWNGQVAVWMQVAWLLDGRPANLDDGILVDLLWELGDVEWDDEVHDEL